MNIIYISLTILCIALMLILWSSISSYRSNRRFVGGEFSETPIIRHLINRILPKEDSNLYMRYSDYMFCLDSRRTIRDLYMYKILCTVGALLIALSIISTNFYIRYKNSYNVSGELPITITSEDYKHLSEGIDFNNENAIDVNQDILKSNITLIQDDTSRKRFENTPIKSLYMYVGRIHASLNNILRITDLFIVLGIVIFGWFLPSIIVKILFSQLEGNELLEADDLETDIYMSAESHMYDILESLINNSMFYCEMFNEFYLLYKDNAKSAYDMVACQPEFPDNFKGLIRDLNLIDSESADKVRVRIKANKQNTEDKIFRDMQIKTRKKLTKLNILCVVGFVLSCLRVMISLLDIMK